MPILEWDTKYCVGHYNLDEQHKKIFKLINDYYDSSDDFSKNEDNILNELVKYANEHLIYEERFFDEYNYPDKERHKEIHSIYKDKVQEFVSNKENTKPDDIIQFLSNWWIKHIRGEDKKYQKFFEDNRIF